MISHADYVARSSKCWKSREVLTYTFHFVKSKFSNFGGKFFPNLSKRLVILNTWNNPFHMLKLSVSLRNTFKSFKILVPCREYTFPPQVSICPYLLGSFFLLYVYTTVGILKLSHDFANHCLISLLFAKFRQALVSTNYLSFLSRCSLNGIEKALILKEETAPM